MENVDNDQFVWVEKYRPQTIEDCILPDTIKKQLKDISSKHHIPNLLFSGTSGTGKTTAAKALAKELDCDWLFINASEESGIDTLRTKIRNYASTTSLTGNGKIVILDEADHLQKNSTQPAMRSALEEFSRNCSFILTCNHPNLIIDPLRSRLSQIDFTYPKEQQPTLAMQLLKRVCFILENEGVEYDKKVVAQVIQHYFPDNRKVIMELNTYASGGKIDEGILQVLKGSEVETLIGYMKAKDFKSIRQWASDAADTDTSGLYENLYKTLYTKVTPVSIPEMILMIEEYQRFDSVVPSKEVHLTALAVSIMASVEWA